MNTNHNRIKVSDLETNHPDKILKTNSSGELEFTDASNTNSQDLQSVLNAGSEGKVNKKIVIDAEENGALTLDKNGVSLVTNAGNRINLSASSSGGITITPTETKIDAFRSGVFQVFANTCSFYMTPNNYTLRSISAPLDIEANQGGFNLSGKNGNTIKTTDSYLDIQGNGTPVRIG